MQAGQTSRTTSTGQGGDASRTGLRTSRTIGTAGQPRQIHVACHSETVADTCAKGAWLPHFCAFFCIHPRSPASSHTLQICPLCPAWFRIAMPSGKATFKVGEAGQTNKTSRTNRTDSTSRTSRTNKQDKPGQAKQDTQPSKGRSSRASQQDEQQISRTSQCQQDKQEGQEGQEEQAGQAGQASSQQDVSSTSRTKKQDKKDKKDKRDKQDKQASKQPGSSPPPARPQQKNQSAPNKKPIRS